MDVKSPTNPPSQGVSTHRTPTESGDGNTRKTCSSLKGFLDRPDGTSKKSPATPVSKAPDSDFDTTVDLARAAHAASQLLDPRSRRGRRPIDPELRRTHRITICLSDEEYLYIQRMAPTLDPASRVRMAEWVRDRVFDREPAIMSPMIAEQDRILVGLATNLTQIARALNEARLRGFPRDETAARAMNAAAAVAEIQTLMSETIAKARDHGKPVKGRR